jgi:hypothetical protein
MVGIPRSVAEALDARDEKWRINGRYVKALVNVLDGTERHADMPSIRLFRVEILICDA